MINVDSKLKGISNMFALLICLSLSLASFYVTPAEAKKITLKAISAWPRNENSVANDYLPFIKHANEQVEKKYPGQFKIKYIGGPEAIPTRDQPEALRRGAVDMYFGTAAYYAGIAPAANCGKLTQLTSWEEKERGADAIFDEIHRKKLNAIYLGRLGSEVQFQLYTNVKVKTPEDLKGLRIRTSAMYIDFLKALNTTPISTRPGDVYQALERGVVDGFMWPFFSIRPWGWHEVVKYVVGPPFYKVAHPILINLKRYEQIPGHILKELLTVMKVEDEAGAVRDTENNKKERGLLENAGIKFIEFSPRGTKRYLDMAYTEGWKGMIKVAPVYGPKLKKLLTK